MIKKPEELKKAFVNGATPTEADFGDLIDSFIPRDQATNEELYTLREIIAWWHSLGSAMTAVTPPSTVQAASDPVSPATSPPAPAPNSATSTGSSTVAADGKWHALSITSEHTGTWLCSATTLNARPGYRITNNAIAVVGRDNKRLLQNVDRDSIIPWHTLQFSWQPIADGAQYQLNLRARRAFGPDNAGKPTQIQCLITRQD